MLTKDTKLKTVPVDKVQCGREIVRSKELCAGMKEIFCRSSDLYMLLRANRKTLFVYPCPTEKDDRRNFCCGRNGGQGRSVIEIMPSSSYYECLVKKDVQCA